MISGKTKSGFKYADIDERKFLTWEFVNLAEKMSDESTAALNVAKYIRFILGPEQAEALAAHTAKKNGGLSNLMDMFAEVNEILQAAGNQTKKSSPLPE